MRFSDLLSLKNIDPASVLVMRHKPYEPELARHFHQIAINRPDLFNSYQSTQAEREEKQLLKSQYLASFVGHKPGKALFVGLYKNEGHQALTYEKYWQIPERIELKSFGMRGWDGNRPTIIDFKLSLEPFYPDWKGRLVISWPGGERSWSRWASDNDFFVEVIHDIEQAEPPMPNWRDISWSLDQIQSLWPGWRSRISQWRGIYFILDKSDGKAYVGSAYGEENLLGRWESYGRTGHGGNKGLRNRNPKNFTFSILELVPVSLAMDEVIQLEASWKSRLSTLTHGLNEN